MAHESMPHTHDPQELLSAVRDLNRKVRAAQRGTWFPLLVFGVITLAVIPVYRYAPDHLLRCRSGPGGTSLCAAVIPAALVYWPVALVLAYAVIAAFYIRQSRRRGVGTRIRPYVVTGVIIAVLLAAISSWRAFHPLLPPSGSRLDFMPLALATPSAAIGLALLVLVWVERNLALLAYTLVYLAIVLFDAGRVVHATSLWSSLLPRLVIPAAVLLAGSAGFALLQRATGRPRQ